MMFERGLTHLHKNLNCSVACRSDKPAGSVAADILAGCKDNVANGVEDDSDSPSLLIEPERVSTSITHFVFICLSRLSYLCSSENICEFGCDWLSNSNDNSRDGGDSSNERVLVKSVGCVPI